MYRYKLVYDTDLDHFEEKVGNHLNSGWVLATPTFVDRGRYIQPMSKYESISKKTGEIKE